MRPEEVTAAYSVESRTTGILGLGFGVTWTRIVSPKYGAVTDPTDATQKVIARTDEDARAGQVAAFLDYRFLNHLTPSTRGHGTYRHVNPVIQVGAGANTSFYVGIGLEVFKIVRIGYGLTWQKVTKLTDPQHELAY